MKKFLFWMVVLILLSAAYVFILVQEKKDKELQFRQEQTEKVEQMKQANLDQYPEFFLFPYESDKIYVMYTNPQELTVFIKTKAVDQERAIDELSQYFKSNQKDFNELKKLVELEYKMFSEVGNKYINLSIE